MPPRGVFVRTLHENPETACAKISALCSFCVHHVAVSGEAVNSNNPGGLEYSLLFMVVLL